MQYQSILLTFVAAIGCSGGSDRLIPSSDREFRALERPEVDGECQDANQCQDSCVHSCVPLAEGPSTCPSEPLATPERLQGATCGCFDTRCIWQ